MTDKTEYKWLWNQTKPQHIRILFLIIGDICISLLNVFFALYTKKVIDSASVSGSLFMTYSIGLIIIVLIQYCLNAFLKYLDEYVCNHITKDMRLHLMRNILAKDYAEVLTYQSGEWMNRMFSDIQIIASGCTRILPGSLGMLARLLMACGALLFLEPVFAMIYLCAGVCMIFVISILRKKLKALHKISQRKEDTVHSFLQEMSENLLVIKSFDASEHMLKRSENNHQELISASLKRRQYSIAANSAFSMTFRLGYVLALIWGGKNLLSGVTTYGTLMAVLQLVNQIQTPVARLSGVFSRIYEVLGSTERVMEADHFKDVLHALPDIHDFEKVSFQDVCFQYDRDMVLDHVSFEIPKNDIVALTGMSGAGKSTIFLLLMGIYNPVSGEILFDQKKAGKEISGRKLFAYVPQNNALFSGTIAENITWNTEHDEQKLMQAIRTADAEAFIKELPDGIHTRLSENGGGLSVGQVQRIAIARAIYHDAPVLLLDEATSALDEETEARVLTNIKDMHNKTVIIVTHRKAGLNICNHHLILENGTVREKSYGSSQNM